MEKDLETKARAVNSTWVKRCNKHFYILKSDLKRNDFLTPDVPDDRKHLVHKIWKTYEIITDNYLDEFDWVLKADDDTYVIVENLRYLLRHHRSDQPNYLGFHFDHFIPNGYMSGGAGYVLSKAALKTLVSDGIRSGKCQIVPNKEDPENSEDLETGKCLHSLSVKVVSSLDSKDRETFHPYKPNTHLLGGLPGYIFDWAKHKPKYVSNFVPLNVDLTGMHTGGQGRNCCSQYSISYHYMSPNDIYLADHLLYHTSVHGRSIPIDEGIFEKDDSKKS